MKRFSIFAYLGLTLLLIGAVQQLAISQKPSQEASTKKDQFHEVTEEDITRIKDLQAQSISVLGVHLGTSFQAAKQRIARKKGVFLKQDKFNHYRLYLYDYEQKNGKNIPLGYFKWNHRDSGLQEIILYQGFGRYMAGKSRNLVTAEALSYYEEGVGKNFLGYPHKKEKILHVPSQDIKHVAYYYKDKSYQVIKQKNQDKVQYAFGIFEKSTKAGKKSQAN